MFTIATILALIGVIVGTGVYLSKRKYGRTINEFFNKAETVPVEVSELEEEFDRIEELKDNLEGIRRNIENLDIPTPKSVSYYDDTQSVLNKLSSYFEEHSLATVGIEQGILSLLPTSQIGQSLQAMAEVLPPNLGHAILGNAFETVKDNVWNIPTLDGLEKFVHGMVHLDHYQMLSVAKALEHHQISDALLTPIKHGALEAFGVHDVTHELVNSLSEIGSNMGAAVEASTSIGDLTNASDIDVTGHIPVVTIALSSFREFQLLSDDKTDYISAMKNIALDAVGAGAGAAAGAKVGAMVGSALGPAGSVAGGILGGILGAITGRKVTNEVKKKALKNAIKAYETSYYQMKNETEEKSKDTLVSIQTFAENKREEFKGSEILEDIPVSDCSSVAEQIAFILYQFIVNEVVEMRKGVSQIKKSIWYSAKKYDALVFEYEQQIEDIENQLPTPQLISSNPRIVIDVLTEIEMPNRKAFSKFQDKINDCREELKKANDKNDSSILMWSYMVNNFYQKTLNDIVDFSNEKMGSLNRLFSDWKDKMTELENLVEKEKEKLGIG